jgi:uncharacterized membrane protein
MADDEQIDVSEPKHLKKFYRKLLKIITIVIIVTIIIIVVAFSLIGNYSNCQELLNALISMVTPMIIVAAMPYIVIILAYLDEKKRWEKNLKSKCPQCGNQNRPKAKFCENCGTKLSV